MMHSAFILIDGVVIVLKNCGRPLTQLRGHGQVVHGVKPLALLLN